MAPAFRKKAKQMCIDNGKYKYNHIEVKRAIQEPTANDCY